VLEKSKFVIIWQIGREKIFGLAGWKTRYPGAIKKTCNSRMKKLRRLIL
jgi:hypothetical protein